MCNDCDTDYKNNSRPVSTSQVDKSLSRGDTLQAHTKLQAATSPTPSPCPSVPSNNRTTRTLAGPFVLLSTLVPSTSPTPRRTSGSHRGIMCRKWDHVSCNRSSPSASPSTGAGEGREGTNRCLNTRASVSSSTVSVSAGMELRGRRSRRSVRIRVYDGRRVVRRSCMIFWRRLLSSLAK